MRGLQIYEKKFKVYKKAIFICFMTSNDKLPPKNLEVQLLCNTEQTLL